MNAAGPENALDHVVVVMFENRSFDNVLGRLYEEGEVASFEGVVGRNLSNPIPEWAEDADRGTVPYGVAPTMDTPNPDPGEELPHINTQLFGVLDERNRGVLVSDQFFNTPEQPDRPTMDGFVTDYISMLMGELGRPPRYDEYSKIMTGYTPEQMPVLSALARGFATFDHWFCDVPTCTFPNRSFFHAGTSAGYVVNTTPADAFPVNNTAETLFDRLDANGLTWRVYCDPPSHYSLTGIIHASRLRDRFATNFFSTAQFFEDAETGQHPTYAFIEPQIIGYNHNDMHPPLQRAAVRGRNPARRCPRGHPFRQPVLVDRWRGTARPPLRRDPHCVLTDRLELPQYHPASDLRRTRRQLRSRPAAAGSATAPFGRARPVRLHLRPLRRASPHPDNLGMDPRTNRRHRRVPGHVAAGDHARTLEPWRTLHRPRRERPQLREHHVAAQPTTARRLARRHRPSRSRDARHARPSRRAPRTDR
jgi:hypothetical protein